jgi:hypothetical protein
LSQSSSLTASIVLKFAGSIGYYVAGSIGRYMVGPRPVVPAAGLAVPVRMVLKVWLPKQAAGAMVSAAIAKETAVPDPRQQGGLTAGSRSRQDSSDASATNPDEEISGSSSKEGVVGAVPQQPVPRLSLLLRSDFHEVKTSPVAVRPYKVALLGTSAHAASLLQAALMPPPAEAAGDDVQLNKNGSWNSSSSLISGLQSALASWWSAPPSVNTGTLTPPPTLSSSPAHAPSSSKSVAGGTNAVHSE